jgi:hypothetical protein
LEGRLEGNAGSGREEIRKKRSVEKLVGRVGLGLGLGGEGRGSEEKALRYVDFVFILGWDAFGGRYLGVKGMRGGRVMLIRRIG